jgi:hypothetical protein
MLDLGKFLTEVRSAARQNPVFARMALMTKQIEDAINQLGTATGTDPTGFVSPPDPPSALNVKPANGLVHVTLEDNSQRSRGLHYFVEADTDPSFPQPHVEHLGVSRGRFISLPAKDDNGNPQSWYFRAYSMQLGSSQPSAHQVLGGTESPTAVNVGGTTQLTPLPSTGSGTASTSGQQGGTGFGVAQYARSSK